MQVLFIEKNEVLVGICLFVQMGREGRSEKVTFLSRCFQRRGTTCRHLEKELSRRRDHTSEVSKAVSLGHLRNSKEFRHWGDWL